MLFTGIWGGILLSFPFSLYLVCGKAPCQVELENWVNSIHSACAAAFARHRGKTGTLHLLQEEIFRIDRAIESDSKLKHMAELQLSVVSDVESKQQILGQIQQWEENLERLHCEQFRLRCYMASLQSGELPNPKGLLMHVSRTTKGTLSRLGVFTVSSFHAYICARSPSLLNNLLAGRGATKRRAPMLSRSNSVSSRRSLQLQQNLEPDKVYKVSLPDNQIANITLREAMTVEEFLVAASSGRGLNPLEHFVRVKKRRELEETNYFVPHRTDLIENYLATHEVVEICAKILYQVELSRSSLEHMWGFSVEAELIENSERQDELCCYISRVEDRSTAMQNGIIKSDEIMVINGAIVSDLDMMYIESVLQEELALCLMMRSSRTEPPDLASLMKTTDEIIESLVCPPPPSESSLNEEMISSMIVPAPSWSKQAMAGHHIQSGIPGVGSGHLGMNMTQGIGMNNMGSMGGLNSLPMISHGYNGINNYGMGNVMMGIHQQQMPHSMMQYAYQGPYRVFPVLPYAAPQSLSLASAIAKAPGPLTDSVISTTLTPPHDIHFLPPAPTSFNDQVFNTFPRSSSTKTAQFYPIKPCSPPLRPTDLPFGSDSIAQKSATLPTNHVRASDRTYSQFHNKESSILMQTVPANAFKATPDQPYVPSQSIAQIHPNSSNPTFAVRDSDPLLFDKANDSIKNGPVRTEIANENGLVVIHVPFHEEEFDFTSTALKNNNFRKGELSRNLASINLNYDQNFEDCSRPPKKMTTRKSSLKKKSKNPGSIAPEPSLGPDANPNSVSFEGRTKVSHDENNTDNSNKYEVHEQASQCDQVKLRSTQKNSKGSPRVSFRVDKLIVESVDDATLVADRALSDNYNCHAKNEFFARTVGSQNDNKKHKDAETSHILNRSNSERRFKTGNKISKHRHRYSLGDPIPANNNLDAFRVYNNPCYDPDDRTNGNIMHEELVNDCPNQLSEPDKNFVNENPPRSFIVQRYLVDTDGKINANLAVNKNDNLPLPIQQTNATNRVGLTDDPRHWKENNQYYNVQSTDQSYGTEKEFDTSRRCSASGQDLRRSVEKRRTPSGDGRKKSRRTKKSDPYCNCRTKNCDGNFKQYKPPLPPKPPKSLVRNFRVSSPQIYSNDAVLKDHSDPPPLLNIVETPSSNSTKLIKPPADFQEPCHNVYCSFGESPLSLRFEKILQNYDKISAGDFDTPRSLDFLPSHGNYNPSSEQSASTPPKLVGSGLHPTYYKAPDPSNFSDSDSRGRSYSFDFSILPPPTESCPVGFFRSLSFNNSLANDAGLLFRSPISNILSPKNCSLSACCDEFVESANGSVDSTPNLKILRKKHNDSLRRNTIEWTTRHHNDRKKEVVGHLFSTSSSTDGGNFSNEDDCEVNMNVKTKTGKFIQKQDNRSNNQETNLGRFESFGEDANKNCKVIVSNDLCPSCDSKNKVVDFKTELLETHKLLQQRRQERMTDNSGLDCFEERRGSLFKNERKEPASPDGFPPPASDSSDRSNVSSLEIESFLKLHRAVVGRIKALVNLWWDSRGHYELGQAIDVKETKDRASLGGSISNVPASCLPSPKLASPPAKVEDQQLRYFLQKDKITSFDAFKPERNLQKQYKNLIISRSKERLVCLFMTDNFTECSLSVIFENKPTLCSPLTLSAFKNSISVPLVKMLHPNNGLRSYTQSDETVRLAMNYLRDFLVLPCKRKLQYITSSIDKDQVLRETFDKVETLQQKNVFLLVDEVQIRPTVSISGGLLSGMAENNRDCKATSILITR
ncbi:Raf-like Ras-binding [Trinorchestia longiramus]|nr:Raf-like Ras-binding [Trinorchestia longiramus]